MAVVGVPLAMWLSFLGCGLALERLARLRVSNPLLLPLGMCVALVLVLPTYGLHAGDAPAIVLLVVVTLAGLVFAEGGLRARLNPGLAGAAGLAVYVLYMLPVIAHGHWTWSGYDFVNDSSFEMLLAEHLRSYGSALGNIPESGEREFLNSYLHNGYPLGTQALLGTFGGLTRTPAAVIYDGYIASLAGTAAVAVTSVVARLMASWRAALVGLLALSANLTYQYALQGGIKEIGLIATLCALFALTCEALAGERPYKGAVLCALGAAASLCVYNAVAIPYLGALALLLALAVVFMRGVRPDRRWIKPALLGIGLTAVLAVPALMTLRTFFNVAQAGQGASGVGATQFGQLLRALPLSQLNGVWLAGEYRLPVIPEPAATLTVIATVAIFALLIPGLLWSLSRRQAGVSLALLTIAMVMAIVYPRVSPYAQGKLLAIASPFVVLGALVALSGARGRLAPVGLLIGVALALAILASDFLAYSRDRVAPTGRIEAITQTGDRFAGSRGLVLWNEFEEYAKYFARAARISVPFEALTPQQVQLRNPTYFYGHYFDLDEELLPFVEGYPVIVTRRSPAASRPPANYQLVYSNAYYLGWRRQSSPQVLAHIPGQQLYSPSAPISCRELQQAVARSPRGAELVAAVTPYMTWFEPLYSRDRSYAWGIDPAQRGAIVPNGAGHASGVLEVKSKGRYAIWVQGDFPGPVEVRVDGRLVGSASGSDTPGQWAQVSSMDLAAGRHRLSITRAAGHRHFGPGEWNIGVIGAVALQREEPERLEMLPLSRWKSLCARNLDWVELTRP